MDLLGIAALGGLERITIVFGAIVIGAIHEEHAYKNHEVE